MIFLTIGTLDSFDRLVQTVDELVGEGKIRQEVLAQIGPGKYQPKHLNAVRVLDKMEFDRRMEESEFIISHGMGSIITAITLRKPMIVMPRLRKYREHVNDHQLHTANKFQELGIVLVANNGEELLEKIAVVHDFKPAQRKDSITGLKSRISGFLNQLSGY
jgi:UDP-N-acetylglucosamine transferase subunit ALG13